MEYAHRILGRLIGLVFLVPFLFFLVTRKIEARLLVKLVGLFSLGALQGLLGWYMVQSGLVSEPHVSQYRLTAHLSLAIVIYGFMLWVALDLSADSRLPLLNRPLKGLKRFSAVVTLAVAIMIVSGGFVAGTKAGYVFNTFPSMNGEWIPQGVLALDPPWRNVFENVVTIQFLHRMFAGLLSVLILAFVVAVIRGRTDARVRNGALALFAVLLAQVALGITTLIYRVPVPLAAAHQAGALLLISAAIFTMHAVFRASRSPITQRLNIAGPTI